MEYCSYCGKSVPPEIDRECWIESNDHGLAHFEVVFGKSGQYLVGVNIATGRVVRDDRPWQMREGVS